MRKRRKKRKPVRVTSPCGTFIIREDSSVYAEGRMITYGSEEGEEKHLGTLIGFVTEEKFHELFSDAVTVDNLKRGDISKEPESGYTMIIKKPDNWHKELFPDRPSYEIRIQHIEYL